MPHRAIANGSICGPRYDTAHANQIVARAAELHSSRVVDDEGYSLGGIQQAAAEVGIPPDRVSEAVAAIESVSGGLRPGGVLGVSSKLELERFVETEISSSDYAALLEEIRVTLGEIGDINETLGNALSWSSPRQGAGRKAQILVSPKGGKTRIRITDGESTPSAVVLVPISFGSLVLIGITGAVLAEGVGLPTLPTLLGALGVSASFFTGTFWAARRSHKREMSRRLKVLSGLMDRLGRYVRDRGSSGNSAASQQASERNAPSG
jgi:hypothetical protein